MKRRLFVDMDGTLAVFTKVPALDYLYREGYFLNLAPHEQVVQAVRNIVRQDADSIEVFVLSAYLIDSEYALQEKTAWVRRYLPEIDRSHRLFIPNGADKRRYVPGGVRSDDCLLDDFTRNLLSWSQTARGIKLLNDINHSHQTWQGDCVRYDCEAEELARQLAGLVCREEKER